MTYHDHVIVGATRAHILAFRFERNVRLIIRVWAPDGIWLPCWTGIILRDS